MTRKHWLNYESVPLAEVDIEDTPAVASYIKEMVEFWSDWESDLEYNDGDYTVTFLKSLAMFMLRNSRIPKDDEGWVPFDGSCGITISNFYPHTFQEDAVEIS